MIKNEIVAQGTTVEEAIINGCAELGIDRDDAQFEILEMPKQKTLGLFGGAPAVVRVYQESNRAEDAADYLRSIIDAMGLEGVEIDIVMNEDESGAALNLTGDALGAIIGRRGETLAALQYLVSLAANNGDEEYFRVAINIGNYREKREGALEKLASKTAQRSLKIGKNLALDPMNPYERRIIHTAVQQIEGVSSWSVGDGSKRHVVIGPEGVAEGEDGLPVNHSRSGGSRSNDRRSSSYNKGGYNKNRSSYGKSNNRGGYNKGGNNRGGHNKNRSSYGNSSYNKSRSSYNSYNNNTTREIKKDSSAPLYGRIEVPKRDTEE